MTKRNIFLFATIAILGFTSAGASTLTAAYVVPATAQTPEVSYPVNGAGVIQGSHGANSLTFRLPDDLVGNKFHPLTLVQSATDPNTYVGTNVSATCQNSDVQVSCQMQYAPGYTQYLPALSTVVDYLSDKYSNAAAEDLNRKLEASILFHNDPEGQIIINLN